MMLFPNLNVIKSHNFMNSHHSIDSACGFRRPYVDMREFSRDKMRGLPITPAKLSNPSPDQKKQHPSHYPSTLKKRNAKKRACTIIEHVCPFLNNQT